MCASSDTCIFHGFQGDHYAVLAVSDSVGKLPESDPLDLIVEYSEIKPNSQVARTEINSAQQSTILEQGI